MIEEAVSKIHRGNCVLFTGAGFSYGLPNFLDEDIPQVGSLIEKFLDIADVKEDRIDYDLESASSVAFNGNDDQAFEYIQKAFRCKKSDESRRTIASQPWRRIYTANYDDAYEVSAHENKVAYSTLDIDDKPIKSPRGAAQVVHIHGSISNLTTENFKSVFYLTDEQSRDISFDRSNWRRVFLEDITYSDAVFFVGFSNSDFHIRRLLDSVRHLSDKIFFITKDQFSRPARQRVAAYGAYVPIGVNAFAEIVGTSTVSDKLDITIPQCFIERSYPTDLESIASREDVNLELLLGTIDPLNFGRLGVGGYYFDRLSARGIDKIADTTGTYVFYSDVGNGKTTILHQLASLCFRRGRKVFQYTGRQYDIEEAREFISNNINSVYLIEISP